MKKKNENIWLEAWLCAWGLGAVLAGIAWVAEVISSWNDDMRYLVVDKGDNKIVYEDLDNMRTQRVLDYSLDTDSAMSMYYKYINVGDTLNGRQMNREIINAPFGYTMRPHRKFSRVSKINGLDAYHAIELRRQVAQHDSVIGKMKTRQK